MISRRCFLGAAVALTAAAPASFLYDLKPRRIADDTYVLVGANDPIDKANGGAIANIGFVATSAGTVVIDAGPSVRYGAQLRKVVEDTTGQPVVRVYLTHFHPDHIFGARAFDPGTVASTPDLATLIRAEAAGFTDGMYRLLGDWMRGTEVLVPAHILTADHETFGSHPLGLLPLKGHSAADLAVFDEATGVLFASDLIFCDRAPSTPHADLPSWRAALTQLARVGAKLTVPGHGRVHEGIEGIEQTLAWLEWLEQALMEAASRGLDMTEAMALPIPATFAGMALARYELQRSVVHFYPKIESQVLPRVDGVT